MLLVFAQLFACRCRYQAGYSPNGSVRGDESHRTIAHREIAAGGVERIKLAVVSAIDRLQTRPGVVWGGAALQAELRSFVTPGSPSDRRATARFSPAGPPCVGAAGVF